jgi:hypothetical protein
MPFGIYFPFALSPISTRRRMASERLASLAAAHDSTCAMSSFGIRAVTCGSLPVGGLPRFLGVTLIDLAII